MQTHDGAGVGILDIDLSQQPSLIVLVHRCTAPGQKQEGYTHEGQVKKKTQHNVIT